LIETSSATWGSRGRGASRRSGAGLSDLPAADGRRPLTVRPTGLAPRGRSVVDDRLEEVRSLRGLPDAGLSLRGLSLRGLSVLSVRGLPEAGLSLRGLPEAGLSLRGLPEAGLSLRGLSLRGLSVLSARGLPEAGLSLRGLPAPAPPRDPPELDLPAGGLLERVGGLLPPGRFPFDPDVDRDAGRSDVTLDPLRHGSRTWS